MGNFCGALRRCAVRSRARDLLVLPRARSPSTQCNKLLRITRLVMERGTIQGMARPEEGETNAKICGRSYAFVEPADHDNSALQFYALGPRGDKMRRDVARRRNGWGSSCDAVRERAEHTLFDCYFL